MASRWKGVENNNTCRPRSFSGYRTASSARCRCIQSRGSPKLSRELCWARLMNFKATEVSLLNRQWNNKLWPYQVLIIVPTSQDLIVSVSNKINVLYSIVKSICARMLCFACVCVCVCVCACVCDCVCVHTCACAWERDRSVNTRVRPTAQHTNTTI